MTEYTSVQDPNSPAPIRDLFASLIFAAVAGTIEDNKTKK